MRGERPDGFHLGRAMQDIAHKLTCIDPVTLRCNRAQRAEVLSSNVLSTSKNTAAWPARGVAGEASSSAAAALASPAGTDRAYRSRVTRETLTRT